MTTEIEAREIFSAIQSFQEKDAQTSKAQFDADLAVAQTWYDTLGIDIQSATTRTEALDNYNQIKSL